MTSGNDAARADPIALLLASALGTTGSPFHPLPLPLSRRHRRPDHRMQDENLIGRVCIRIRRTAPATRRAACVLHTPKVLQAHLLQLFRGAQDMPVPDELDVVFRLNSGPGNRRSTGAPIELIFPCRCAYGT